MSKADNQRFNNFMGKNPKEPEFNGPEEYKAWQEKDSYEYSDEEIKFMASYNFDKFSDRFPSIAEYYIACLDD